MGFADKAVWQSNKIQFMVDLVFAALLLIPYLVFGPHFSTISLIFGGLFLAGYLFLGLGLLFFLLLFDMNERLASILHIGTFPILSIVFLFQRWLPEVTSHIGGVEMPLSLLLLVYVLMLVSFLDVQLYIYWKKETKQTS